MNTEKMMASGKIRASWLVTHAWLNAARPLLHASSLPVVFVNLLSNRIKTTSPANGKDQPRRNAFSLKMFTPLSAWLFPANTATLIKDVSPVTTNEKFVQ